MMERSVAVQEDDTLTVLEQADRASEWLPDYMFGWSDESELLPELAEKRLVHLSGDGDSVAYLAELRSVFSTIPAEHQANIGLYIAGYPEDAIEAMGEGDLAASIFTLQRLIAKKSQSLENVVTVKAIPINDELSSKPIAPRSQIMPEAELIADREAIALLEKEVVSRRVQRLAEYVTLSAMDHSSEISAGWLEGESIASLAQRFSQPVDEVKLFLARINRRLLSDPVTSELPRALGFAGLEWQEEALCAETDPELFFPEKGGSARDAKKLCGKCAVRVACLDYALEHDQRFGIWGGLSERERRKSSK